jgi:hypothetical protein
MKKTRKPTPEEQLQKLSPTFDRTRAVAYFFTLLDLRDSQKKNENAVLFERETLTVWRGGEMALCERMENLERISLGRGVG